MAKITDAQINQKYEEATKWLSETVIWGHGSLLIRITPRERLIYFRYTTSNGKRDTMQIGTYRKGASGYLTLADARARAQELAALHKSGIHDIRAHLESLDADRLAERQAAQNRLAQERAAEEAETARLAARKTVRDAFNHWNSVELTKRKDGGASVVRMFNANVFPYIGEKCIADLTRGDVLEVIDHIRARGAVEMGRETFTCIRQLLRFAHAREWINSEPTAPLNKRSIFGQKNMRERWLTEVEITELSKKLPAAGLLRTTELAVWIALSTCCRIGELMTARWEHVDLEAGTWYVPDTKNGRAHTVYLSQFSAEQFRQLRIVNGRSAWCYPNTSNTDHVNEKSATKQIVDRQRDGEEKILTNRSKHFSALTLPGGKWRPHDLRRTGATMMTILGVIPEVAERCLNHTEENKIKRTYQRYTYANEMREAWRLLGERLALLTNTDLSNVIVMPTRKAIP